MLDDSRIEAFIGRNAAYYRQQWQRFHEQPGSMVSFNVAAFFLSIAWLLYRRLYLPFLLLLAVGIADVVLISYADENQLLPSSVTTGLNVLVSLLYTVVVGVFGNYWYWTKFRRFAVEADSREYDETRSNRFFQAKGGTNAAGAWAFSIALLLPTVWALYWASPVLLADADHGMQGYIFDATGPLTLTEVRANLIDRMDTELSDERRACVFREVEERALAAGDPEVLDPATVERLSAETWDPLDAWEKRLILAQAITSKAFSVCRRAAQ